jgi:tRNA dimethylallyltransferase
MMLEQTNRPIFISGATGSGKSSLGIFLAKQLDGEIINCDSVQVYKDMIIGSARVSDAELADVPHHLIGHVRPDESYSVGKYLQDFCEVERDIQSRGKRVIVVGGTTLYVRCLIHGLAELPPENSIFRASLKAISTEELYARLRREHATLACRYHPNDRLRITRALELIDSNAVTQLIDHQKFAAKRFDRCPLIIIPVCDRVVLSNRLRDRAMQMINDGIIQEVDHLVDCYGSSCRALSAVGYAQVMVRRAEGESGRLANDRELADAVAIASRQYAKRQATFWRNEPIKMGWRGISLPDYPERMIGDEIVDKPAALRKQVVRKGMPALELNLGDLIEFIDSYGTNPSYRVPSIMYISQAALETSKRRIE